MDCGAKGDFSQKLRARGQAGIDENRVKGKEQIAAYTGGFPHFMSRAKPKEARKTSLYALKTPLKHHQTRTQPIARPYMNVLKSLMWVND